MPLRTPVDLRADLLRLRATMHATTIDAVLALLEHYGVLDGLTPDEAGTHMRRSGIRVRQLANDGQLDGIRLGDGKRSTLLLSAASVEHLAQQITPESRHTGRPRQEDA